MHELILFHHETKSEIGRRHMSPGERFEFYRNHMERELLLFQGGYYTTYSVAWCLPEENFVANVAFHSNEHYCDC